jgi:hypothetical protein
VEELNRVDDEASVAFRESLHVFVLAVQHRLAFKGITTEELIYDIPVSGWE